MQAPAVHEMGKFLPFWNKPNFSSFNNLRWAAASSKGKRDPSAVPTCLSREWEQIARQKQLVLRLIKSPVESHELFIAKNLNGQ